MAEANDVKEQSSIGDTNDKIDASEKFQKEHQHDADKSSVVLNRHKNKAQQLLPDLILIDSESPAPSTNSADRPLFELTKQQDGTTKVTHSDGRISYYDEDGTLTAVEKDGKRWELKYDGDTLVRYQGPNSYLEYRNNGWSRCTESGCKQIEGFKIKAEDGVEQVVTGRVTKQFLADPGVIKFADIPEIAERTKKMLDLIHKDGAEGAVKYLAGVLSSMDSHQLEQFERQYAALGGSIKNEIQSLRQEGQLSSSAAEILTSLLANGCDKRTPQDSASMAMKALSEPNQRIAIALLNSVLGGTSEQVQQARSLFLNMGGEEQITRANLSATLNAQALDIVKEGSINPATLVRDNLGTYSYVAGIEESNIDTIVSTMTDKERKDYLEGERLSKTYGPYSTEQERQIAFYNNLRSALKEASSRTENIIQRQRQYELQSDRKLLGWEDMIRHGGKKDFVALITEHKNDLDGVKTVLTNMSKEEFELLKSDPAHRRFVESVIQSTFNAPNQASGLGAINVLDRILSKSNYEDASRVSASRFFDEMGLNYRSPRYVADLAERGDSTFRQEIKSNPEFKKQVVDAIIRRTDEGSAERALALDSIDAIVEGREGSKSTALKRTILKGLQAKQSPLEIAASVKSTLANSPELKEQIAGNPQLAADMTRYLAQGLKGNQDAAQRLLAGEGLTIDQVKSLATKEVTYVTQGANGRDKVVTEPILSKQEAVSGLSVLSSSADKSSALDRMKELNDKERQVADAISSQGSMRPEDTARMFVINLNNSTASTINEFANLGDVEKLKASAAYKAKYGGNLIADVLSKVSDAQEKARIEQTLNVQAQTSLGTLSRGLEQKAYAENVSSFGRAFTETIAGNVYTVADKNAQTGAITVKELQARKEALSDADKKRLNDALSNMVQASQDIRNGKKEALAKLEQAAIAAGVILSVPATMGYGGIALLAGSATLAGLSEAVLRQQIKGADYDHNDLIRDAAFIATGALLDGAPAIARSIARATVSDSKAILKAGISAQELQSDLQKTIKLASLNEKDAQKALRGIAKKYAADGNEELLYVKLDESLGNSANDLKLASRQRLKLASNPPTAPHDDAIMVAGSTSSKNSVESTINASARFEKKGSLSAGSNETPQYVLIGDKFLTADTKKITFGRLANSDYKLTSAQASRVHAEIELTERGPLLRNLSATNPTLVNSRVVPAEGVLLKQGDIIEMGNDGFMFGKVMNRSKVMEYKPLTGAVDVGAAPEALRQSTRFRDGKAMSEPLEDGFQMTTHDVPNVKFNQGAGYKAGTVFDILDRTQDTVLRKTIEEAHIRFDSLKSDPRALAEQLTKFAKQKMEPAGWTPGMLDASHSAFTKANEGKRILLGNYIQMAENGSGGGVCAQQAFLYKVLADDFGLNASLVDGHVGASGGAWWANHVWNEVRLDGKDLVFDPRQQKIGLEYKDVPFHTPVRDIARPENTRVFKYKEANLKPGDAITFEGSSGWRVSSETSKEPGHIVLLHDAIKNESVEKVMELNSGRQLVKGQKYELRRGNGDKDLGWIYDGKNSDGTARFMKKAAMRKEVSVEELKKARAPVWVPFERERTKLGDAVSYEGEEFTLVRFDGQTGKPILHQPDRGAQWATVAEWKTPEEFQQQFEQVVINGESVYADRRRTVFYSAFKAPNGKYLVSRNHKYVFAQDLSQLQMIQRK